MTHSGPILVCPRLRPEVEAALEAEGFTEVEVRTFSAICGRPQSWSDLDAQVGQPVPDGSPALLLGGDCLADLGEAPAAQRPCRRINSGHCLELFVGSETINEYVGQGCYLMTSGWLKLWPQQIREWGFDQHSAREFFAETSKQLLLLDTGVGRIGDLAEFSEFLDLPTKSVPVGLAHLRLHLARSLQAAEIEGLERALKREKRRTELYADELELANEEVKQFAYTISHDLRAPLVNIKGFVDELGFAMAEIIPVASSAIPGLPTEQRETVQVAIEEDVPEAIDFITSSVAKLDQQIAAVLNLSRFGRMVLTLEKVEVRAVVESKLESLKHQLEQRQSQVTLGDLPAVWADRISLEQMFGNLLDNAVKYHDPSRPLELEISAEVAAEETTIHVRDNGCGIDASEVGKVFVPFRRAGSQQVDGTGMGLAYVSTLVRRHRGRAWVDSTLGVGSTFSFSISRNIEKEGFDVTAG